MAALFVSDKPHTAQCNVGFLVTTKNPQNNRRHLYSLHLRDEDGTRLGDGLRVLFGQGVSALDKAAASSAICVTCHTIMENAPQRYVAHLDILGMRALTARDHHEALTMLVALHAARTTATQTSIESESFDDPIHTPEMVKSVAFSDTVVFYSNADTPRDFKAIFMAVVYLFSRALHLRVPIRIGISKGIFFADEQHSIYAGPALIEAYDIGEASQWLGIVLSPSAAKDAIMQKMRKGNSHIIVDWDLPTKTGTVKASVANWPVALEGSFHIKPPLTPEQLYQIFEQYYGPFAELRESDARKYINTVKFINEQYALHTLGQANAPQGADDAASNMNRSTQILRRALSVLAALALLFWFAPILGQTALRALTSDSAVQAWNAEFERLDGIFPRVAANETRRLELIRKLRQRGIRIDEGVDESIDHKDTPYTIFIRGCRDWERLLGW